MLFPRAKNEVEIRRVKIKMNREQIIAAIDEEIGKLHQVRSLLQNASGHRLLAGSVTSKTGKKRVLSPEARQRIAQAQKRRWAKHKKEAAAAASPKK
jgi:hypothetical protein